MSWDSCLQFLREKVSPSDFQTWLAPLQCEIKNKQLFLYAPNKFVVDWVSDKYLNLVENFFSDESLSINEIFLSVGSLSIKENNELVNNKIVSNNSTVSLNNSNELISVNYDVYNQTLIKEYIFNNYVEGKCNMLARAAAMQIVDTNDCTSSSVYNPFLIYGGVGLGKTHLLHAIGNSILEHNLNSKVLYITSQKFVHDMVTAFQNRSIDKFKSFYGSVDALLVDDIQFFADKERSQEEFFHIFNNLLEGQKQIIMTCDTYPKEVKGIEDRLISRFSWGLSVGIEMPDIETRVAILISKASELAI
ncbi:MAG: ATP-binding protein, partial [Gammaproteobacteria bacterium]|nr:ATP-binding protein [Gammaproteobacteria bacterium]